MANSLKHYAIVGFENHDQAQNALEAAKANFHRTLARSREMSYLDKNIVYFYLTDNSRKNEVETFLLNQPGAQPKGHRHKA